MTDSSSSVADANSSDTTPCQFCGDEYQAPRGIATHERHCEENPENQSEPTQAQSDETTSESEATETLEKQALERDGCQCRRCGATGTPVDYDPDTFDVDLDWDGDLDVDPNVELTVEPLVPGDSVEALQELVTLCPDCADIVDGLHYLTKRTEVFFNNAISK